MSNPTPLILIAVTIGLSLLTTNNTVNSSMAAMAASKGNGGASAGPVIQELVNTGNPTLDKEINKFYSCITKTHQDPPSIQIVDNCYYQTSIGGISRTSNINNNHNQNHNNNPVETRSTRISSPPPGVLVDVP